MNRLEVCGEAKNPHEHEGLVVPSKPYYALYSYKVLNSDRFDLLGNSCLLYTSLPATMSEPTEVSTKYKYLHVSLEEVRVFNPETGKVYYQSTAPFSDLPLNHNMNRILSTNIRLCFS